MSNEIEDAAAVSASHDGGPDWEVREKGSFNSRRGNVIRYRRWCPKVGTKVTAMLMIAHGLHEHSGRWAHVAHFYTQKGYLVYANDHIAHGMTVTDSPADSGLVDDHTKITDDFADFVEKMVDAEEDKTIPVFVLGHSMGSMVSLVAAKELQDSPAVGPRFKKLVLSACPIIPGPGASSPFGLRILYPITRIPSLTRGLSGLLAAIDPKGPAAPIRSESLSLDPEVQARNKVDPLMVKGSIRNKTANEVMKLVELSEEAAGTLRVPTRLIHGGKDDIAYPKGSEQMMDLLKSCPDKELKVFDGLFHEVLTHKDHFGTVTSYLQGFWDAP